MLDNQTLAHHYANRVREKESGSNFFYIGDKLYSYGTHFCVARRLPSGAYVLTTQYYSSSTGRHVSIARRALFNSTIVYAHDPNASAYSNRVVAEDLIVSKLAEARTTRRIRPTTRDRLRAEAFSIAEQFNTYLAALPENERGIAEPFDLSNETLSALAKIRQERQEAEQAERKARQLRAAEAAQEKLADWLNGGNNAYELHSLPCALRLGKSRGSHHTGGLLPDTGSVGRDVIQTSHGAEIPVKDGKALWPLIQSVRKHERTPEEAAKLVHRLGVYHLRKIDPNGDITVGCHHIVYKELERIAKLLGLVDGHNEVSPINAT